MQKKYSLILFVLFILMAGCSSEDNKPMTPKPPSELPIFNEQVKALEKAKEVEKMLQVGMDKQKQAIDEVVK
jgi:PBP1b-binding outer membrane lipoprotein LpoB